MNVSQETWELEAYIDGHKRLKLSGIPQLSISTQFIMQVWNRDNYIPELSDVFRTWEVAAKFKDLIFPPEVGKLCRYGAVFQSGTNPIVRYEVGIGSQIGLTDVQPFTEVQLHYYYNLKIMKNVMSSSIFFKYFQIVFPF